MVARRRGHAAPAVARQVRPDGPDEHRPPDRPAAPPGALRRPPQRPIPQLEPAGPVGVDESARARRVSPCAARRHALGAPRPQPRRLADPPAATRSRARRGRPKRCRASSSMSPTTGSMGCGGSRPRRGCAAASWRRSPGAHSTSRARACRSTASCYRPTAGSASARRSRRARGAPSRSTRRPSPCCALHREAQILERASPGTPTGRRPRFCDELGGPFRPERLTECFGAAQGGRPRTGTLHALRHTRATQALSAGIPSTSWPRRLGDDREHACSTYAHLLPQSDELAADVGSADRRVMGASH